MGAYLVKRLIFTLVTVILLSISIFAIIQAPPGDAVDTIVRNREMQGDVVTDEEIAVLKAMYGLDKPLLAQYWDWFSGFLIGDMGLSVRGQSVSQLIAERLPATISLALLSLIVTYIIAIPIGIYSATHQYGVGDYIATTFGFAGLAVPNFLLALVLLYFFFKWFGLSIGGFLSPEFHNASWSLAKGADLIKHLAIPVIVIATASTAGTIRTMRATLLDELGKQYVMTARAKGVPYRKLLLKYPTRLALNPIVSGLARIFPFLLAGQTIVAIVLNLPTLGPLLFEALTTQDLELAASVLMIMALLAIFGVIIADILLTWLDPRIRLEKGV